MDQREERIGVNRLRGYDHRTSRANFIFSVGTTVYSVYRQKYDTKMP